MKIEQKDIDNIFRIYDIINEKYNNTKKDINIYNTTQDNDIITLAEQHIQINNSFEKNLTDINYILIIMKNLYEKNDKNYIKLYNESLDLLKELNLYHDLLLHNHKKVYFKLI